MKYVTLAAVIIFFGFVAHSVRTFGMKGSWSAYAAMWADKVPLHNMNLWSIVMVVTALLLIPPMIARMDGSPIQFLGFLVPLYLGIIGLTPRYQTDKKQRIAHLIGATVCLIGFLVLLIWGVKEWKPLVAALGVSLVIGYASRTLDCYVFWLEMSMAIAATILPL